MLKNLASSHVLGAAGRAQPLLPAAGCRSRFEGSEALADLGSTGAESERADPRNGVRPSGQILRKVRSADRHNLRSDPGFEELLPMPRHTTKRRACRHFGSEEKK